MRITGFTREQSMDTLTGLFLRLYAFIKSEKRPVNWLWDRSAVVELCGHIYHHLIRSQRHKETSHKETVYGYY